MNKLLLSATALLLSGVASAQMNSSSLPRGPKPLTLVEHNDDAGIQTNVTRAGGGSTTAAMGDTIFYESFGNGLNGDGTNGAWTNNGTPSAAVWEYRGTGTNPTLSQGSRGAYAGTNGAIPIASPTNSNGFVIFDSDYLDNGGVATNMGNGPAPTPHYGELVSPVINLSAYNDVILQLNVKYRRFVSDLYVVFSTNGTTWTDSVMVYGDAIGTPSNSDHLDEVLNVYVTDYIGGSSTAYMKLFFDGVENHGNVNGSGYYYSMIDDIYLFEAPDNDLRLDNKHFHSTADTGYQNYYSNIPLNHAELDSVYFGGNVTNLGSAAQPNTQVNTYITRPSGSVDVFNSQAVNLAVGSNDSLYGPISNLYNFGSEGLGTYQVDFVAESDSTDDIPSDNTLSWDVNVTDSVYAFDADNAISGGRWYGAGTTYAIGNMFAIRTADTVKSMSVEFSSITAVGSIVSFYLYEVNDLINGNPALASNQFVSLTANQIGQWATFDLPDTDVQPGYYVVVYESFSDSVLFTIDENALPSNPTTVWVNVTGGTNPSGGFGWSQGSNPHIRMNVAGFACAPLNLDTTSYSPATCGNNDGGVQITLDGNACPTCTFDWGNQSGVGLDTRNDLAAGVYTVTVSSQGCVEEISVTIGNENGPIVDAINVTDVSCFGDSDGEISLSMNASSGTAPFTYNWSTGTQTTTPDLTGLTASNYNVTITDDAGCTAFENNIAVGGPATALSVSVAADSPDFGDATATATGGTSPYSYSWSSGETTSAISGTNGGTFTVTVTDANGCTTDASVNVTPVGTENIALNASLDLFPNPNSGEFNIRFKNLDGVYTVNVYSTIGQLVESRKVNVNGGSQVEEFNTVNLTQGIYFVNVKGSDNNETTLRVVVK